MDQTERFEVFRALHARAGAFVIPNVWDAGSARLMASLGFEALATTSAGYAFSKGKRDSFAGLSFRGRPRRRRRPPDQRRRLLRPRGLRRAAPRRRGGTGHWHFHLRRRCHPGPGPERAHVLGKTTGPAVN